MSWDWVSFADAPLQIIDGDRGSQYPKQSDYLSDGPCLFLNTGNVTTDGFAFANTMFVSDQKDAALKKGKLTRNDIVMTTRGTIGNCAYYHARVPYESVRINSGMVIFRAQPDKLMPAFLYQYLRSNVFRGKAQAVRSGAAQPQLPIRDIKTIDLPLPPLAEQQRIAANLSTYDDLLENNRRRIAALEETTRQIYREWFVRFRFPGHEHIKIVNGLPEGWRRTSASEVMDVLSGGTPKTTTSKFWNGEIGLFTPKDAVSTCYVSTTEKTITEEGLASCNSKLYPNNTLFITARGTVGKLNLALAPMAMNQSCYALVSKSNMSQRLLYLTMGASLQQLRSQASGAVFDAIVVATFDRILVTVPDSKAADSFDEQVRPIFDLIAKLGRQNEQLAKARDLLLPKLMSGAIAV